MSDTVCELTDLERSMCAHCRGLTLEDPAPTIIRTFESMYDGRCARCEKRTESGDTIGTDGEGNYYCERCTR